MNIFLKIFFIILLVNKSYALQVTLQVKYHNNEIKNYDISSGRTDVDLKFSKNTKCISNGKQKDRKGGGVSLIIDLTCTFKDNEFVYYYSCDNFLVGDSQFFIISEKGKDISLNIDCKK